jgi:hypothetical protein
MRLLARIPRIWRWIAGVAVVLIVSVGAIFVLTPKQPPAPVQPIDFSHKAMVGSGVPCLYCHADATRSAMAGMPSVEKCMGCHRVIRPTNTEVQKLAAYWQNQQPIPWVRVYTLPRYVYFSHEVHVVNGGLNCEQCHGDVAHMEVTQQVVDMNMGWCLDCHEKQPNHQQLMDCIVCHQ